MSEKLFKSSELAAYCTVSKKTIRHYKKLGLLEPYYIDSNNYWYFNVESIEKLNLIQKLKKLNFSLDEIKEFLKNGYDAQQEMIIRRKEELTEFLRELEDSIFLADQILKVEGDSLVEKILNIEKNDHDAWIEQQSDETIIHLHKIYSKEKHSMEHHKIIDLFKNIKVYLVRDYKEQLTQALNEIDGLFSIHFDDAKKRNEVMKLHVQMLSTRNGMTGIYIDEEIDALKLVIDEFYEGNYHQVQLCQ